MVKKISLLVFLLAGFSAVPAPSVAAVSCTQDLVGCYEVVAQSFWWDGYYAMGCDLLYANCVRHVLLG